MTYPLKRRDLLKYGIAGIGLPFLPLRSGWSQIQDDHFLYMLHLDSAADFTYLFDARPLEMTKNNLQVNYMEEEPTLWTGLNGQSCWASTATAPLHAYKNDFSIVNGVFVHPNDIGHTGPTDILFSGSQFGGPSFLPLINTLNAKNLPTTLDGIKLNGRMLFSVDRHQSSLIELSGSDVSSLIAALKINPQLSLYPDSLAFVLQRMQEGVLLNPQGQWSQGSGQLHQQLQKASQLARELSHLDFSQLDTQAQRQFLQIFSKISEARMGRVALEVTAFFAGDPSEQFFFDDHGFPGASETRDKYQRLSQKIANTLEFFKTTAFDSQRSLLDVTTFVVTTEFGRTMRQQGVDFATSGTDHNPLCNSYLFAGKGIRTGCVFGASDFQSSQETLSGAHLQLDKDQLCLMAKPFDFTNELPLDVLPEVFNEDHYLNVNSIVNTLLRLFSVPEEHHRRKSTAVNSPLYPYLRSLLK